MAKVRLWGSIVATVLLAAALLVGQGPVRLAEAAENRGGVQLLMNGRVVASFQEVSGLGMEVTVAEAVCRADGRDDDCDGVSTEAWQAEVLTALWQVTAAADQLELSMWAATRSRHDTAKNAIGNIRARVAGAQTDLQDGTKSLKTRHESVKNAINNIRAAVRALSVITANDDGLDQAQVKAMQSAVSTLTGLSDGYRHRYRPGRPVFGNITFKGAVGSLTDASLLEWFNDASRRKSGSVVFLDQGGRETARYNLFECWPVRFTSSHAVEELEFAVERVERSK